MAATTEERSDEKNHRRKKRRLTKRERKNLKKQKTSAAAASTPSTDDNSLPLSSHSSAAKVVLAAEPTLEEYMANYIPAPSVKFAHEHSDSKSLGKWFPKASVIKSSVCYSNDYLAKFSKGKKKNKSSNPRAKQEPKASLLLFYQYVKPTWSDAKVSSLLTYLTNIAQKHRTNIGGRIRVSSEGINATVSAASRDDGDDNKDTAFEAAQTLRHFTKDLENFDPHAFADTDFKYIDGLTADRHFKELKLLPVKELVFYGIREEDCAGGENDNGKREVQGGIHLDARDFHEMLKRNDAVVIDVRNHYEAAIGRFDGQVEAKKKTEGESNNADGDVSGGGGGGGATYIDPKMRKSTDFTSWLAEEETKQKLEGKTVMMFCTGGIRCERASAYLDNQIGSKVNGIYQLKGGIERYLKEFPDGGFWRGKNFVFDKREAISAGNINGDGGVVRKDATSVKEKMLKWGAECAKCKNPWDRYVGKRKCFTCGVPVLVCDACMSQLSSIDKKRNDSTAEDNDHIRCPLCVDDGINVAADDVEWTDNGVRGHLASSSCVEKCEKDNGEKAADDGATKQGEKKAATSVLKWGGGHAKKKKVQRSWSRRPCHFGVDCARKDCIFYHPERESTNQKEA